MARLVAVSFITMCILKVSEDISPKGPTYDVTLSGQERLHASFQVSKSSCTVRNDMHANQRRLYYYALFNTACRDDFIWRKTPAVMFYASTFQFKFQDVARLVGFFFVLCLVCFVFCFFGFYIPRRPGLVMFRCRCLDLDCTPADAAVMECDTDGMRACRQVWARLHFILVRAKWLWLLCFSETV